MKIAFTGAHGTGKTTLVEELRKHNHFKDYYFNTNITRKLIDMGIPINEEGVDLTQKTIMDVHHQNLKKSKLLTDRCVLDCFVYTWYLCDHEKVSNRVYHNQLKMITKGDMNLYDKVFYLEPEFEIVSDGVRSDNKRFQVDIYNRFEYCIKQYGINVIKLTGSVEERIEQLFEEILK